MWQDMAFDGHSQQAVAHAKAILASVLVCCLQEIPKVEEALLATFHALDEEIMKRAVQEEPKNISSGVVIVRGPPQGRHVYVANC